MMDRWNEISLVAKFTLVLKVTLYLKPMRHCKYAKKITKTTKHLEFKNI